MNKQFERDMFLLSDTLNLLEVSIRKIGNIPIFIPPPPHIKEGTFRFSLVHPEIFVTKVEKWGHLYLMVVIISHINKLHWSHQYLELAEALELRKTIFSCESINIWWPKLKYNSLFIDISSNIISPEPMTEYEIHQNPSITIWAEEWRTIVV